MLSDRGIKKTTSATVPPRPEVASGARQDLPIYAEWIRTLDGLVSAGVKAQVTGYLLKQTYLEGSFVRKAHFDRSRNPQQPAGTALLRGVAR